MASAYQGQQFSTDESLYLFLYGETRYVLETRNNQMFSRAVSESEDGGDKQ